MQYLFDTKKLLFFIRIFKIVILTETTFHRFPVRVFAFEGHVWKI